MPGFFLSSSLPHVNKETFPLSKHPACWPELWQYPCQATRGTREERGELWVDGDPWKLFILKHSLCFLPPPQGLAWLLTCPSSGSVEGWGWCRMMKRQWCYSGPKGIWELVTLLHFAYPQLLSMAPTQRGGRRNLGMLSPTRGGVNHWTQLTSSCPAPPTPLHRLHTRKKHCCFNPGCWSISQSLTGQTPTTLHHCPCFIETFKVTEQKIDFPKITGQVGGRATF